MTAASKGTQCVAKAAYVEHEKVYNNKNKALGFSSLFSGNLLPLFCRAHSSQNTSFIDVLSKHGRISFPPVCVILSFLGHPAL